MAIFGGRPRPHGSSFMTSRTGKELRGRGGGRDKGGQSPRRKAGFEISQPARYFLFRGCSSTKRPVALLVDTERIAIHVRGRAHRRGRRQPSRGHSPPPVWIERRVQVSLRGKKTTKKTASLAEGRIKGTLLRNWRRWMSLIGAHVEG